jgi:cellulose synthase (UDP-forming)
MSERLLHSQTLPRSDARRGLLFLEPVIAESALWRYRVLIALWVVSLLYFWAWWLRPEHVGNPWRYGLVTALLGWLSFLQAYFVFFLMRASRPASPAPRPGRYRVAMVVTKTPSEPFAVVRATLEAMLAQDYPHDTWLADEAPSRETIAWCMRHGVHISTRKGRADYHRAEWPRRTRCKEGNLAFFYDHWGYDDYDIVVQMDADHVPQPGYLIEMLRPFADEGVGYVSAPSICAANAATSWAARTRLHTEAAFHGVLQAGYSNGFAPMCIGSHYAVRTKALRQVGGLGPELAEDHSTTMILNAGGWRGVHAIDAIAVGDGPATVADMVTQEFQWSRSLLTLLLRYSGPYLARMPWHLRGQFLFCQMFYPLFAVTLATMYTLPMVALIWDVTYGEVTFPAYVGHAAPPMLALVAIAVSLRRDGFFRPVDAPVISWEKALFLLLQWPWVAWGCVMAVRDRLTGRFVDFRITPKGEAAQSRLPFKVLAVYAALALGCLIPVILVDEAQRSSGFYLLALFSGVLYGVIVAVTVVQHYRSSGTAARPGDLLLQVGLLAGLAMTATAAVPDRIGPSTHALLVGLESVIRIQPLYHAAGAGTGPAGRITYRYDFPW